MDIPAHEYIHRLDELVRLAILTYVVMLIQIHHCFMIGAQFASTIDDFVGTCLVVNMHYATTCSSALFLTVLIELSHCPASKNVALKWVLGHLRSTVSRSHNNRHTYKLPKDILLLVAQTFIYRTYGLCGSFPCYL